jgi:hypothetical protein
MRGKGAGVWVLPKKKGSIELRGRRQGTAQVSEKVTYIGCSVEFLEKLEKKVE